MLLSPIGWLYGKIADIRNTLYEKGVLKSYTLGAKTICIGNITTGGTGKTPLVIYVAEILANAGEKVCILTRGYGRKNENERVLVSDGTAVLVDAKIGGDEPVELAGRLLGKAIVLADADRVSAAAWAKEKFGITSFVLDDGFQHRRAARNLDIVCVDATNPFGNKKMLPAGSLREPLENLSRADALVLTRTDLVERVDQVVEEVRRHTQKAKMFFSQTRISNLQRSSFFSADRQSFRPVGWKRKDIDQLANDPRTYGVLAFCAIGNPDAFFKQLSHEFEDRSIFEPLALEQFPDHHTYSQSDIDFLEHRARDAGAVGLITTAKDGVKFEGLVFSMPCYVVEIESEIDNDMEFRDLIISS